MTFIKLPIMATFSEDNPEIEIQNIISGNDEFPSSCLIQVDDISHIIDGLNLTCTIYLKGGDTVVVNECIEVIQAMLCEGN